jgi:hypothetical protein
VADKPTKGQRRYANPPKIKEKLAMPTMPEAQAAAPVADAMNGADGVTVNVNITRS